MISKFINKDIIDPGTLRLKQEQRNQFTLSGYFVVQRDIVPSDTVCKHIIIIYLFSQLYFHFSTISVG